MNTISRQYRQLELQRIQSTIIIDRMNMVVGALATGTPEFSDELEYIELNPTWTVPYCIATKEMLPRLRANPYAYAAILRSFPNGALPRGGPSTGMPMGLEISPSPYGRGRDRRMPWARSNS